MILTQNIIKKIDLNNIYAIGNSLIIPVIVNIDKVLANNAKYIKTCILPKNIEYKTITNNVLFPTQVEKSNSENNAVKNSKIINHRSFGNNITLDYSKRILSKNSITTGQDLFEKQDLFISTQEKISNNNNITIYSILDINQVRYSLGRDDSILPGAYESSHQFVVSILNKDNVVLDFSLIDQVDDVKVDDYYQNVEEFDFEDIILQYLNTFSDSIDITINPYVFEGLQQRVVSGPVISYNSSILGLLENTLNTQNISRLTSPAKLKFEILGNIFYIDLFNIEDNDGLFRTNNDLEVNNLSVALATKMIQENLVKNIREYFSISENPLNYTVSLTTIYSNTQISRDYIITRQEALQLYSDYERKNRQKIIEDEFRNKIDFTSLDSDTRNKKIVKITCNKLDEDFVSKTGILNDSLKIKFELVLPRKEPLVIPLRELYLDDELTEDNKIISTIPNQSSFLYNTLFNDPNTNIFYYGANIFGAQIDFSNLQINVYVDNILIDKEQTQNVPRIDILTENFRLFNTPTIPGSLINIAGQDNLFIPNDTSNITNTLNRNLIPRQTSSVVRRSTEFEIGNLQSFVNSLNVLDYNLSNGTDTLNFSKVLENTLLEIKTIYNLKNKLNNESIYYVKAIDIYDSNNSSFKLQDDSVNIDSVLNKTVTIKSVVFEEGKLEKLFDENATDSDKESIFQTLNKMNNSLYSFYINKFERSWFKSYTEDERKAIYKDIFKVYENQALDFSTITQTATDQSIPVNEIQINTEAINKNIANTTLKNNLVKNRNNRDIIKMSSLLLTECLDYKKRDIQTKNANSNIQFSIENGQILLNKISRNKKYNLKINTNEYDVLKDLENSNVEIVHHINLGFYKDAFNSNEEDITHVSDMTFLTLPNSLYTNKKISFTYKNGDLLLRSFEKDSINLKFDEEYYNKCIEYWNGNGKDLYLNFIIEKYVIKITKKGKDTILSYNNLIPASETAIEYIQKHSVTKNNSKIENLGINLLGGKLFKPNFNILYN